LNTTETWQLLLADKLLVHPFEFKPNPAPLTATAGGSKSTLLLLVNVIVRGVLVKPA